MKKLLVMAASSALLLTGIGANAQENPFFGDFKTPYQVPDFQKIKLEHYIPAYQEAIKQHDAEIASIIKRRSTPTFESIIVALDNSGEMLNRVSSTFNNVLGTAVPNTLLKVDDTRFSISPLLSKATIMLSKVGVERRFIIEAISASCCLIAS